MAVSKKNKTQPPATVQNFPIIGIGASAGGLDAFKRLLTAITESSGMAYVLVQHLDPSHESFLPEILQRVTKIPVHEITDDIHLAPDHIYIIPSNKILTSTDGVLQLTPRDKKTLNLSIDAFFTSLAEVHKEFAVGVVLSGTGNDGTLGLKAIKEHGGISIAQDSESATYNSMPQSAVNAGVVDFILAPEKIPEQLLKINRTYKTSHVFKEEEHFPKDDEEIFKQIILALHHRSGVDFSFYKRPTFHRRIARRIAMVNKNNLSEYLKFLRANVAEQDALFQDVLIPVTSFFRDPKTFQNLNDIVFPALFKDKPTDEPFRVWIAGCSTGEEAFSIAISLREFLEDSSTSSGLSNTKIQIFASDISEKAIKKARAAIYTKAEVEHISDSQLKKYFVKANGNYELSKIIRDICVFAPHNFLKDPPFAKMDLISCRNVLIYMDTFLQKKALTTFHYALKEKGFLLLGKSETIGACSDLFSHFVMNDKIYSRKPVPGRFMHVATERKEESLVTKEKTVTKPETVRTDFRKSAEQIMILRSPVSVVVNEQMDIVHIHGDISPFLQQPQGKPSHNLMKMAKEGLAFELRNAIHKAKAGEETVIKEDIPVKSNGEQSMITIEITPLTNTVDLHYLIQFNKKSVADGKKEKKSASQKDNTQQIRNKELEKELLQIREDMRSITEDMEAYNEELQSANEELQSSNEEMQSLNEELETSREELQSTNEELIIVNQELLEKQEQLNSARYYAESIVSTIREPLIVLDKTLRIKTANASFYKVFNAEEQNTEGKLFYEIQNHQWDDHLMRTLLEKILPEKERLTDFEIILNFPSIGKRTLLLNALQILNEKKLENLILLAIEDITERKAAEQKLETFAEELESQIKERTAALKKTNEELKQTNTQLDEFAYIASHDLQEPLRKILTFSMRLQDKHKDEMSTEVKSFLNKIEDASSRMTTLIQDLLNYSRLLQHEKLFSTIDLNETVKNVLTDFELLILEKKAKIKISHLPTIDAIPLQMNQLFYNLISNTLKFYKADVPPIITITSRILSEKEIEKYPTFNPSMKYYEIIIKDNGIGFEQQYAKQIFTIFQRLHDKEVYLGTGIGLALSKKIIENHHGEIFAVAKEKKGASFHVILPLKQP
ncbi:MAG: chemotaxis protein CheB [Lutibacter sp.]